MPKRFVPILRFSVGTSYQQKLIHEQGPVREPSNPGYALLLEKNNDGLKCTKPCRNVVRDSDNNFTKCTKEYCTYAHTLQQLQLPRCLFDHNDQFRCNRRPGFNPELAVCKFKHIDETNESYHSRMGTVLPDLPSQ